MCCGFRQKEEGEIPFHIKNISQGYILNIPGKLAKLCIKLLPLSLPLVSRIHFPPVSLIKNVSKH